MRTLNTTPDKYVIEAVRLDFALILSSGKEVAQQRLDVENILILYKNQGYISKYVDIKSSANEISAIIYCPTKTRVSVQLP